MKTDGIEIADVASQQRRPRLLFVFTSSLSVAFYFELYDYLQRQGFDVSVISSAGVELDLARLEGASVYAVQMQREISPFDDLVSLWQLWRVIRKIRPDIINVGTPKAGLLGGLAALMAGVPRRIYTLHGLRLETTQGWSRKLLTFTEQLACSCAHQVRCVSSSLRKRAIDLRLVEPGKAQVVGPGTCRGVHTGKYRASDETRRDSLILRRKLGIAEGTLVLGFVGRFTRDKGIVELYEAFTQLRAAYSNLRLLMVGDFEEGDPVSPKMRARIESDLTVIRPGFVTDVASYLCTMDVLALPTYREGFPGVVLEAQASSVPVVTTDATGAIDSLVDGVTGIQTQVGHVGALAAA